jgi:hypothetical protein
MKTNWRLVGLAAGLAAAIAASNAGAVSFVSYGTALPPGETLITDFSNSAAPNLSGDGLFVGGSYSYSAAPAFSASTVDTNQYLSLQTGQTETVTFSSTKEVSVYLGSLDSYNLIAFSNGQSFDGDQLAVASGADDGNQTAANTNGRFIFNFASPVDSVTLSSSGVAFEVADVAGATVPEPSTWAIMLVGFGAIGASMRSRRRQAAAIF